MVMRGAVRTERAHGRACVAIVRVSVRVTVVVTVSGMLELTVFDTDSMVDDEGVQSRDRQQSGGGEGDNTKWGTMGHNDLHLPCWSSRCNMILRTQYH